MSASLLNLAGFRGLFPEFAGVVDTIVQPALDDAAGRVSPTVYGEQLSRAHGLMAADILVSSPWGHAARLNAKVADGRTTYSAQLDKIRSERASMWGIT